MPIVMLPEAHILLLTEKPERRRCWVEMLSSSSVRITRQVEDLTDEDRIDVVITEHDLVADLLAKHRRVMRGSPGIISVGASPLADVALPSDFSRRELKLACLLLAEVVQLRRQIRRGQRAQKLMASLSATRSPEQSTEQSPEQSTDDSQKP
ncbi:MAG: hypothetical protein RIC55_05015 [Pirellulaceae bacterium]